MTTSKILTVIGLLTDIIGVAFISYDVLFRPAQHAKMFLHLGSGLMTESGYGPAHERKAVTLARFGAICIGLGFLFQLVACFL